MVYICCKPLSLAYIAIPHKSCTIDIVVLYVNVAVGIICYSNINITYVRL